MGPRIRFSSLFLSQKGFKACIKGAYPDPIRTLRAQLGPAIEEVEDLGCGYGFGTPQVPWFGWPTGPQVKQHDVPQRRQQHTQTHTHTHTHTRKALCCTVAQRSEIMRRLRGPYSLGRHGDMVFMRHSVLHG